MTTQPMSPAKQQAAEFIAKAKALKETNSMKTTTTPPDDDYEYQERAAILEFDAGLSRAAAELKARQLHPLPPRKETKP